ncbi:MAG: DNA primase [Desulfovibrio sp.]|nr:DNA primase [Desulfovibrio sp.]
MRTNEARLAIKARLNIVTLVGRYVELKRNGARLVAPCPFHQETKPSFYVDEHRGTFYCFGCHAKGDVIQFYSQINGIQYREALVSLAKELGITLDGQGNSASIKKEQEERRRKTALEHLSEQAAQLFMKTLEESDSARACQHYIEQRGLSPAICKEFGLGYSLPSWDALTRTLQRKGFSLDQAVEAGLLGKNKKGRYYDRFRGRLMFPIMTFPHRVIAFGGRIIEDVDEPKYINSSDTPIYRKGEHLYGLVQAVPSIRKKGYVLLTEGYMDVLTLHQFGFKNACGVLGTALTQEQIQRLTQGFTSKIVLLFDGDNAGRKAALRAVQMIVPKGIACSVVLLPDPEDIDSLLRKENGPALFEDLLAHASDGLDFFADCLLQHAPREMIQEAHAFLQQISIPELLSPMVSRLAKRLGLSEEIVRSRQATIRQNTMSSPQAVLRPTHPPASLRIVERQLLMFAARYPEELSLLFESGAETVLQSEAAKIFWQKLQDFENCPAILDPLEKSYWDAWCGVNAPPRSQNHDHERQAILRLIDQCNAQEDTALVREALRLNAEKDDFASDLVYLQALQQTVADQKSRLLKTTSE